MHIVERDRKMNEHVLIADAIILNLSLRRNDDYIIYFVCLFYFCQANGQRLNCEKFIEAELRCMLMSPKCFCLCSSDFDTKQNFAIHFSPLARTMAFTRI